MARRRTGNNAAKTGEGYFDRVAAPAGGRTLFLAPHAPRFTDPAPLGEPFSAPPAMAGTEPAVRAATPSATVASSVPASFISAPLASVAKEPSTLTARPILPSTAGPPGAVPAPANAGAPTWIAPVSPPPLPPPRAAAAVAASAFDAFERLAVWTEQPLSVQSAAPAPQAAEADVETELTTLPPSPLTPPPATVKPGNPKLGTRPAALPVTVTPAGPPPEVAPAAPVSSPLPLHPLATPAGPAGPSIHIGLVEVRVAAPASAPVAPVLAPRTPGPAAAPRTALTRGYGWRYGFGQS